MKLGKWEFMRMRREELTVLGLAVLQIAKSKVHIMRSRLAKTKVLANRVTKVQHKSSTKIVFALNLAICDLNAQTFGHFQTTAMPLLRKVDQVV